VSVRVRLVFPDKLVREPMIARLVHTFAVEPNIRRASVEEDYGWMILELDGEANDIDRAVAWLTDTGVRVELLGDVVES
jgi:ABC-type methionine transport system ATPase subunit